ncbi:MAG TPA: pyridoxal-phosphate dependent enzyme [Chitinophagaceae bacterium]|nr:pyridoxal-phosphate dependent enzyme [Chitinophagaceae bacterium]
MIAAINELVNLEQADMQRLMIPVTSRTSITANVLRIDKIHATISGNKWFKLRYALQDAIDNGIKNILTFGGAYSNHLLATAYACARLGLDAVGVIRGERPATLSETLRQCSELGMQLHFVTRELYAHKRMLYDECATIFPNAYLVAEGGADSMGVRGAADILQLSANYNYTHVCCAVGTGATLAGLLNAIKPHQSVTGISALNMPRSDNSVNEFIQRASGGKSNYRIFYDYHFGGYARKTTQLLDFMNSFYTQTGIATDFVYTAKLFYGVMDLIEKDQFPAGSRLLIIHSGGLQGNSSLLKNSLVF